VLRRIYAAQWLESKGKIKGTEYWSGINVADGINALIICCGMHTPFAGAF
jgi:hypothetical protein